MIRLGCGGGPPNKVEKSWAEDLSHIGMTIAEKVVVGWVCKDSIGGDQHSSIDCFLRCDVLLTGSVDERRCFAAPCGWRSSLEVVEGGKEPLGSIYV